MHKPLVTHGRFIDLTGKIFNNLTIIEFLNKKKFHDYMWKVRCFCGNIFECRGTSIKNGHTKSCGCLKTERVAPDISTFNSLYSRYRSQALERNKEFNLTKQEFRFLTQQKCYYCNTAPHTIHKVKRIDKYNIYFYNGIDRVNNELGYVKTNVVTCCETCNRMKLMMSHDIFLEHINKIYKNKLGED